MSLVLPRLDRALALELIDRRRHLPLDAIGAEMPDLNPEITYAPVGGARIDRSQLSDLRAALLEVAHDHGMPGPIVSTSEFEAKSARLLHERLDMTPHEASHETVWTYLTCCWLLDIAVWRFGSEANVERFVGHLNRNTFRRMWWRVEVLGPDVDLAKLGEDELVNIMERPTLFSDRRLARAIALELISRADRGVAVERMRLMREATKRLLRLTPFVAFAAMGGEEVRLVVADAFDAAASGLAGAHAIMPHRYSTTVPTASPEVDELERMEIAAPTADAPTSLVDSAHAVNFDEVAQAALDIVRRTGRVTNIALREVVPMITAEDARDVFRVLIDRGELVRRGVKRGTHYVLPAEDDGAETSSVETPKQPPRSVPPPPQTGPRYEAPRKQRPTETALRRLLRRVR